MYLFHGVLVAKQFVLINVDFGADFGPSRKIQTSRPKVRPWKGSFDVSTCDIGFVCLIFFLDMYHAAEVPGNALLFWSAQPTRIFKGLTPFPERECLARSFSICASVNRGSTWKVILPSSYRGEDVSGGWMDPSLAFFFYITIF